MSRWGNPRSRQCFKQRFGYFYVGLGTGLEIRFYFPTSVTNLLSESYFSSRGVKPTMPTVLATWRRRLKQRESGKGCPESRGNTGYWVPGFQAPPLPMLINLVLGSQDPDNLHRRKGCKEGLFKSCTWRARAGASRRKSATGPHSPPRPSAAWGSRWAGRLGVSPLLTRRRKTAKSVVHAIGYLHFHNIMVQTRKC